MAIKRIVKNIPLTTKILLEELSDFVKRRVNPANLGLTNQEEACLADLRRDGFVVVKDYWPREKALKMRDRLEAYLTEGKSKNFENGAYLRFWDNKGYDQGVRRIYHVERLMEELNGFRNDPFVMRVAAGYYGIHMYSGVLTFQHNTRSNTDTRYYHIDQFGKQFKSFLYLDDVDEGNGPHTYLRGTHRSHFIRLKKQLLGNAEGSPTSFFESDLQSVLDQEVKICGAAGTLILADVRGLHRGAPQINRSRSILINYMYRLPGDKYLGK